MGCLSPSIVLLCICGVALSLYAIHIERSKHLDEDYKAHCDLDETISCSRVLVSDYSIGLGLVENIFGKDHFLNIPNSYVGVIFFPVQLIMGLMNSRVVLLFSVLLSFASCVISAYLIYVLMYIMHKICILCMSVHFINLLLFILFTAKWVTITPSRRDTRKKKD